MNKFYEKAIDYYLPLSHDNNYLFNHYDRITNFLTFNIDQQYRNLLAKPIKSGYNLEWFSIYPNLINAQDSQYEEFAYRKYFEFSEVIKQRIENFKSQRDSDAINWADILEKVFNENDNFIYTNGQDIVIVWGWKFDNRQIYKPDLQLNNVKDDLFENNHQENLSPLENDNDINENLDTPIDVEEEPLNDLIEEKPVEEIIEEQEEDVEEPIVKKKGFLEFLEWFAATYWWLLVVLLILIVLVFWYKSLIYS